MKFVPLDCESSGGSGAGCGTLPGSVRRNKTLVNNPPERGDCFGFGVKKVFKKSSGVQRLRIGVRFPLLASFRDPIVRFRGVNHLEEARGIEIRAASIVQNAVIISFDSNHDIRQAGREVRISRVFTTELNNHREYICLRFSSTRPMPGCSYSAYPVDCQSCYWVSPLATVERLVSGCRGMRRETQDRVECRHWVEAPVEPKHKFVEVSL